MGPKPLVQKTFKFKKPVSEFFCPLCSTKRAFTINHRLTFFNYVQITVSSSILSSLLWPFMEWRSLFTFFPVWIAFELVRRALFSKQVPCPHCGFDASWYKRDVKVARKKVGEFWDEKGISTTYSEKLKDLPESLDSEEEFGPAPL